MKNLFLTFVSLFFLLITVSCSAQSSIKINDTTDLTKNHKELIEHFQKTPIFKGIEKMSNFKYYQQNEISYIEGSGIILKNGEYNNIVFRSRVSQLKDNNYLLPNDGESCSGKNCSKCSFASKGGCKCDKTADIFGGSSYCDHTISK